MFVYRFRGPERTTPSPPTYHNATHNVTFPFTIPRAINFSGRHSNQVNRVFPSKSQNHIGSSAGNYQSTGDDVPVTSYSLRGDTNTMSKYYSTGRDGGDVKEKNREINGQLVREQSVIDIGQAGNFDVAQPTSDNFRDELTNEDIKPNPSQLTENWMNVNQKIGEFQDSDESISFEPQSKRLRLCIENDQRIGQEQDMSPRVTHAQSTEQLTCALGPRDDGYSIPDTEVGVNRCKTEDSTW